MSQSKQKNPREDPAQPGWPFLHHEIFDESADAVIIVSLEGVIVYTNKAASLMFEAPCQAITNSHLSAYVDQSPEELVRILHRHAETRSAFNCDAKLSSKRRLAIEIRSQFTKTQGSTPLVFCTIRQLLDSTTAHRERVIATVSRELLPQRPLSHALSSVCRCLVEMCAVDHVTIALLDEGHDHFTLEAEYPTLITPSLLGKAIPVSGRPTQMDIITRMIPLAISNMNEHSIVTESDTVKVLSRSIGVESLLLVPMIYKSRVLGTLGIDHFKKGVEFSSLDINKYQTIANLVAMKVESDRLSSADETLRRIYREAESGLSLEDAAKALLENLTTNIPCDSASIQLVVNGRRRILTAKGFDSTIADPDLLVRIEHDTLMQGILNSDNVKIIPNTSVSYEWQQHDGTERVRSWMAIPLKCTAGVDAIVTLDHGVQDFYSALTMSHHMFIERFRQQATTALRDAYLFYAAGRHSHALTAIGNIAALVAAKHDMDTLGSKVSAEMASALSADCCVVYLAQREEERLNPLGCWPDFADSPLRTIPLITGVSLEDTVASHYQGPDSQTPDSQTPLPPTANCMPRSFVGCQSLIIESITSGNNTLGVAVIGKRSRGAFQESDRMLATTICSIVSHAIDRELGLIRLLSIGKKFGEECSLDDLLRESLTAAIEICHKSDGVIFLLNDDLTEVDSYVSFSGEKDRPRLSDPSGITRHFLDNVDVPLLDIADLHQEPRAAQPLKDRYDSMVGVKLAIGKKVLGVMFLAGDRKGFLSPTERSFLLALADHATAAIEKVRLLNKIIEGEKLYHSLLDNVPVSVYRKNRESVFQSANMAFCKSVGSTPEKIAGETDFKFYPPDKAKRYRDDDIQVITTRMPLTQDEEHVCPLTGRNIWVRVIKTPVFDSNDTIVGTQGMFWDITEEKDAMEQYKTLVSECPSGILVVSSGKIIQANQGVTELLGWDCPSDLEGKDLTSVFRLVKVVDPEAFHRSLVSDGKASLIIKPLNSDKEIDIVIYCRSLSGMPRGEQLVFQDVTQMTAHLREINHRVMNSLTAVLDLMLLQAAQCDDEQARSAVHEAMTRVAAMSEIHKAMMEASDRFTFEQCDLAKLLSLLIDRTAKVYETMCKVIIKKNLRPVKVNAAEAKSCAIIVNELLVNAYKHGFEGCSGELTVTLCREKQWVRLTVTDNGKGMCQSYGSQGKKNALGLQLVNHYVRKSLKGIISFDSESQSGGHRQGTHIVIDFPSGIPSPA